MKIINCAIKGICFGLITVLFVSCYKPTEKTISIQDKEYALYLLYKDRSAGFALFDKFNEESVFTYVKNPSQGFNREYIKKERSFYQHNYRNGFFVHYEFNEDGQLAGKDSISLKNLSIDNFLWKNKSDTLILFTVDLHNNGVGHMHILKTKPLQLIRKEILPLPKPQNDYNILSIGVSDLEGDNLWIGYSYSKFTSSTDYTTANKMYYANFNFTAIKEPVVQEDLRSTYPGGVNTVQTYQAKNEKGDLYFMSCPGIALGNTTQLPTAIFRKLAKSNKVDTNYMINISDKIGNHAYGFWYIGEQKAIIRAEQKEKYKDFAEHHLVFQFEYYVVDLLTGDLEKINIPADKGTRKETVLIEDNIVYLAIDSQDENHSLWSFDPNTGETKHIHSLDPDIDFILRLDKIN
ncbi:DUF4374 domain-containing protein [Sphingobacterium sp. UT-1RO-CII-1]|uniref:DUF4374 domain-containing protein n=1 Tax=Sphingobacterium sp. UT-1RO-CII-1 TaxID=2995225 RepID=UPI00227A71AA|nr:DUF4374 domain-containing protein [Sphingobacterium sp. UT-1RO-CII-1]MCY4781503.1 DUF4374 domain-containing protein [Sphingobacterium sp. UT-1RO-CII-1]